MRPIMDDKPVVGPAVELVSAFNVISCSSLKRERLTIAAVVELEQNYTCIRRLDRSPQSSNDGEKSHNMQDQQSELNAGHLTGQEGDLHRLSAKQYEDISGSTVQRECRKR